MDEIRKNTAETAVTEEPAATISFQDGNTTIVVGMHFKQKGRITLDEKLKKLIQADVKAGNF